MPPKTVVRDSYRKGCRWAAIPGTRPAQGPHVAPPALPPVRRLLAPSAPRVRRLPVAYDYSCHQRTKRARSDVVCPAGELGGVRDLDRLGLCLERVSSSSLAAKRCCAITSWLACSAATMRAVASAMAARS